MQRTAIAEWKGDFKEGTGTLTSQSNALNKTPYSFNTRFADGGGTNPEELIAAAHAGCFTMSVDLKLTQRRLHPEMLKTVATVDLDAAALKITGIHLELTGKVSGLREEEFEAIAKDAQKTCIISRILSVPITMNATLDAW